MKGKTILICSADEDLSRAAQKALERCGSRVVCAQDQQEASDALDMGGLSLVIIDVSSLGGAIELLERTQTSVLTIALTDGDDLQVLAALVCQVGIAHVIARPDSSQDGLVELLITANKLLSDDLFGLDKYLRGDQADLRAATLRCASDRDSQLHELAEYLRENKAPRNAIATITNAADEMLTNAMYNAPVDQDGRPRYAATNRRSKIALEPSEFVELRYGIRKGVFGMSVSDAFGKLRLDHLSKSILRCTTADNPIEQKAGGAGLGLFMLAQTAHQFIVNVSPDERTEVIAMWSLDRKKLREKRSHNSLHFFEQAYRLGKASERPKRVMGTNSATSDWDTPASTLPGLGFPDTPETPANQEEFTRSQDSYALPLGSSARHTRRRSR